MHMCLIRECVCVCIFCVWIYEMRHCICMSDVKYISSACGKRANIERMERKDGYCKNREICTDIHVVPMCTVCTYKISQPPKFPFFFSSFFLLVDCVSVCNFENPQRTGIGDST